MTDAQSPSLQFLRHTQKLLGGPPAHWSLFAMRPPLVCRDGFTLSVQASPSHFCNLRAYGLQEVQRDLDNVPYEDAEVYNWPKWEPLLAPEYLEEPDGPLSHVPLARIDAVIAKHGGWARRRLLPAAGMTRRLDL
jgi:hypothetical protein